MSPLEADNPGLHDLVAADAAIERVAGGLSFRRPAPCAAGRPS